MKKILLTGGNGFIGKNIKESYLNDKYEIIAPRSFELDLSDTKSVDEYFKHNSFDVVLHAAGKPGHRNAKDPTNLFYTNVRMFENLERNKTSFGKLINFGSGAIYDIAENNSNVKEEDIYKNCGKDDHSFCKYVTAKQIDYLENFINLNIFGIFGKYEDWEIRFISNAICKALYDLPITLRQNRRFSYLYINDLIPILEFFIENNTKYKHYNIVPNGFLELKGLAETVREISGKQIEIKIAKEGYGLDYYGNNSRLCEEFVKVQFTDIHKSIQELYDYYKSNIKTIDKEKLYFDK